MACLLPWEWGRMEGSGCWWGCVGLAADPHNVSSPPFLTGDNVICGSYDSKLAWFDLDLSTRPYQLLR